MAVLSRAALLRTTLVVATLACAWLTFAHLRVSSDLSALFPETGRAAALARFARAFGGGDPAAFPVRGAAPDEVEAAARELSVDLATHPSVERVVDHAPPAPSIDPTLAWAYAGPAARARLAAALSAEGMRARLAETRALLLAPGAGEASEGLARDPLRLAQIPWENRAELAAGVSASED